MGGSESQQQKFTRQQQQQTFNRLKEQLTQKTNKLNNLKTQNSQLNKQTKLKKIDLNNCTVQQLMIMNEDMFTCGNCQNFFNQKDRLPIMICKKQHSICEVCFNSLQSTNPKICTIYNCQGQYKNLGKNRIAIQFISNKQQLLAWIKQHQKKQKKQRSIVQNKPQLLLQQDAQYKWTISFSKFINYDKFFQFHNDSYLKISQQSLWHTVRSNQSMGLYQIKIVHFKIINSSQNSLIFGISNKMQQFYKGAIPVQSIAYHINNGHIYDKNSIVPMGPNNGFQWRNGGMPVLKNLNPVITMVINTLQKNIKWKIRDQIYAETIIPDIIANSSPIFVYISMYHKNDLVVLNLQK